MFSVQQKRDIADAVQEVLRNTGHPELPEGEILFRLHVVGAHSWSWADIRNNGAVTSPSVNPHNERQALVSKAVKRPCTCGEPGATGGHAWDCPANPNNEQSGRDGQDGRAMERVEPAS